MIGRKAFADEIRQMDLSVIGPYNLRARTEYKLHVELGPCPYEGDVARAPIVLLLANPGFDKKTSTLEDHTFESEGWPLAGLHPGAPDGLRQWWAKRLRELIEEFTVQRVSQSVAALQFTSWASEKFDSDLRLPSQQNMLKLAEDAVSREALIIVMRARKLWHQKVAGYSRRLETRAPLVSYVTKGNVGVDGWRAVLEAVAAFSP